MNWRAIHGLERLVSAFRRSADPVTEATVFDHEAHDRHAPFVPFNMDWNALPAKNRAFLDAWIAHRLKRCDYPYVVRFLDAYLGTVTSAEDYHQRAIVKPLRDDGPGATNSGCKWFMFEANKLFTRLCQAALLFDDPIELFKCWAWNEYHMDRDNEQLRNIIHLYDGTAFPFAYAVQTMDLTSPYFNYLRGFQDISRMRYVSLYNSAPYTWGDLAYTGMSREQFEHARDEAEAYARWDCLSIIACLQALGFRSNYRERPGWRDDRIDRAFISTIAREEGLDQPMAWYAFLFHAL